STFAPASGKPQFCVEPKLERFAHGCSDLRKGFCHFGSRIRENSGEPLSPIVTNSATRNELAATVHGNLLQNQLDKTPAMQREIRGTANQGHRLSRTLGRSPWLAVPLGFCPLPQYFAVSPLLFFRSP